MSKHVVENRRRELARIYEIGADVRPTSVWCRLARKIEFHTLKYYAGMPPRWRMRLRAYSRRRTLPDFCVVGPIKGGTSDLAINVMAHPNVMPPFSKEFWSPDPETWRIFYPTEYEKQRYAARHGVALSVYCVPFLHGFEAIYNLSKIKPSARIVLVLRDPVERMYSHWKWDVLLAGPKRLATFPFLGEFATYVDRALDLYPTTFMASVCGFPALHTSLYWQAVRYWIECFGRDNVRVMDIANYFGNANSFLQDIQSFVGLPQVETPPFSRRINQNPLNLAEPDEATLIRLRNFFRPHNERLWDVIGESFSWQS